LIRTWETENGLPENSATAVVQSDDGYLWFGTFNGLVRFNGEDFAVFNPANTPQLPSAGIVNLHQDRAGRLWVSTYAGLVVLEDGQWRQLSRIEGWAGDYARTFTERSNGDLLVTSFNGRIFEFSGGRLQELPMPPGEEQQGYLGAVDEDGQWWAVQHRFIGKWEQGRWVPTVSIPQLDRATVGCGPARDGGIWLLLGKELRKYRRGVEAARIVLPESPGGVWSVSEDGEGRVWIASFNRGFCYVTPAGRMTRLNATNGGSDRGRCVFEDRERNLWLGTSGDGLIRLTPRRFRHFDLLEGRKGVVVKSVSPDLEGGVWAATYGHGLFHLGEGGATRVALPGLTNDSSYLQTVLADRTGRVWVGTMGDSIRIVAGDTFRRVSSEQAGGNNPIALFEDSRGRTWIGGGGTSVVASDGTNFLRFELAGDPATMAVTGFAEDATGAIWLANTRGAFRQASDQPFQEVKGEDGQSISQIACLKADSNGSMWLGSSRGLWRWKSGKLSVITSLSGIPIAEVQGMEEDREGYLWMTSGRRILRARSANLHAAADGGLAAVDGEVFDSSDGLATAAFSASRQPALARDTRGRLWFATDKGVAMIDPASLRLNDRPPPVQIEELDYYVPATGELPASKSSGRGEMRMRAIAPFAGPVVLPAGSRRLEVRYAALSFSAPEKVRFQVKLEGADTDWRDPGGQRVAYFHDLPPGNYTFRVRAANPDGVWNLSGASLAFTILPSLWQTGGFRFAGAVFLMASGGSVVWWWARSRVRRSEERERSAREIRDLAGRLITAQEEERTRLARELHDDFSQRLALLSVDLEMFGRQAPSPPEKVEARMQELSTQVRELSTEVHRLSHELHPAKLEQLGLAAALRGFCKEASASHQMAIQFESDRIPAFLPKDVSLCLYRIAQEALQNVIKHSGATLATVRLAADNGELCLTVADDGAGFDLPKTRERGTLGLVSMTERVRLIGGHLDIESSSGQGTRIQARVRLKQA